MVGKADLTKIQYTHVHIICGVTATTWHSFTIRKVGMRTYKQLDNPVPHKNQVNFLSLHFKCWEWSQHLKYPDKKLTFLWLHALAVYTVCSQGERWKRLRRAAGKQATPRNVQTYSPAFNDIFQRFAKYIKSMQGEEFDMILAIKLLFVESKWEGKFELYDDSIWYQL